MGPPPPRRLPRSARTPPPPPRSSRCSWRWRSARPIRSSGRTPTTTRSARPPSSASGSSGRTPPGRRRAPRRCCPGGTGKSIKLFGDFYSCDMIVASPLGLSQVSYSVVEVSTNIS
uniref:U3 small nucleolar RNA-associated protein 25 n=1 Tax=Anthurium amnicola TaxID=1678845 RepID=A0A1D1YVG4_9ARAE